MADIVEIIGVDIGTKRTGLARASLVARLAEPLKTIPTTEVVNYLKKLNADAIVVGLPRNLKGEDTEQTIWVRDWVDQAKTKLSVPFYWMDEALTSQISEERQKLSPKNATEIDSLAAAMIVQDFVNSPESEWVRC